MSRLKDKIALITGGASGIGRETARLFAAEGATVVIGDLDESRGKSVAAQLGSRYLQLDVTREVDWAAARDELIGAYGRLDVLVNSAGISCNGDTIDGPVNIWHRTMAVNATGTYLGCRTAVAMMRAERNVGAIVNICSFYGNIAGDDVIAYAASKGAVRQLTKGVALACAAAGLPIRCNSVHPTFVDSELIQGFADAIGGREAMLTALTPLIPMRRLARPEDVARAILFLASDEAAMTNGAGLPVDGAMLAGIVAPVVAAAS